MNDERGSVLVWAIVGIVIVFLIIVGIVVYNWFQRGTELAQAGDFSGWANWFIGGFIVLIIIIGVVVVLSGKKS